MKRISLEGPIPGGYHAQTDEQKRIQKLEKALKAIIEYDKQRVHRFCSCHQIAKDALA